MTCKRHTWEYITGSTDSYDPKASNEIRWCWRCGAISEWYIRAGNRDTMVDIRLPGAKRNKSAVEEKYEIMEEIAT